jgi:hypothetical protein
MMSEKDADGMRCPHYLITIGAVALTGYESSDDSGDGNGNSNGGSDATATATTTATDEPTATETEEPTSESPDPVGEMRTVSIIIDGLRIEPIEGSDASVTDTFTASFFTTFTYDRNGQSNFAAELINDQSGDGIGVS